MGTLSEEFKLVALEDYEFGNQQNRNTNRSILHVAPINTPKLGAQSEIVLSKGHLKRYRQFRLW